MMWPSKIQWISIPSIVFCIISLWNAIIYLICFSLFPLKIDARKKCLLFGLTSLSFANFSFGTLCLYSADNYQAGRFWQSWQFSAAAFTLTFLILFSNNYLKWLKTRLQILFCLITLCFIPFICYGDLFLNPTEAPKLFSIFGHKAIIFEVDLSIGAYLFSLWGLIILVTITFKAIKFYRSTHTSIALTSAFFIFVMTVINDTLVAAQAYHFFYLLEASCMIYIIAMSLQMLYDYVETSTQIKQKNKEIKNLNDEMKFLVQTISHDFTAPLLSIQGFVEILEELDNDDRERFQHYLSRVKDNTQHLHSLVDDLSYYIKAGQIQDPLRKLNIIALFKEVLDSLQLPSHYPNAKIIFPQEEISIVSSEKRLRQILFNLVENALKYSDPQDQKITFKVQRVENGILLTIENHGPNIPPDLHEKIFKPFFRNHKTSPGSGLGLAITKKCVEKLNGSIWIENPGPSINQFCIWLPKTHPTELLNITKNSNHR